jgi:hydrogenase expression/formation protein HypE
MSTSLPLGKIDGEILTRLMGKYTHRGGRVLVGAGIGEDAAVIDMGDVYLVAKTDPITHVTREIGYYAVHVNANDIAAMGGTPLWFLATLLMPSGSAREQVERIFSQISKTCQTLGVVYCGGHTEITTSVSNPVVIGQMLGEVTARHLKPSSGAKEGDVLVMTKSAAIEATGIISTEKAEELHRVLPRGTILKAQNYLHDPGISVVEEARIASAFEEVHALHDPTEGGIATGIYEMAEASRLGVAVRESDIPMTEETRQVCDHYHVSPLGTFASGSLLIAVSEEAADTLIQSLALQGIPACRIGVMLDQPEGMRLITREGTVPLPVYHQDELSKIFA